MQLPEEQFPLFLPIPTPNYFHSDLINFQLLCNHVRMVALTYTSMVIILTVICVYNWNGPYIFAVIIKLQHLKEPCT